MKYCIIGSGAFGINISYNLLKKGNKVTLITDKLESVSSVYARGIAIDRPPLIFFPNIYFKMENYNFVWSIIWFIFLILNSGYYMKYKRFAIKKSEEIVKSYNLNYNTCSNNTYFINLPEIFNKMITRMKKDNNFTINFKKVSTNDIKNLSNKFDLIFDCRGSNVKKNYLCEKIGGYKLTIEANHTKKCFSFEDGWFIHTDINNKNKFIAKGGFIIGSKAYDTKNISDLEMEKIKKIVMNKPFWKKYNCKKIIDIRKGSRQYSVDMIPFYIKQDNIVTIHGGSAVGAVLSPYVSDCIINEIIYKKKQPYDFSKYRAIKNYNYSLLHLIFIIFFIIYIFYKQYY